MSDEDLAAIRAKRLAELQVNYLRPFLGYLQTKSGNASKDEQEKAREQQELMKNAILKQVIILIQL